MLDRHWLLRLDARLQASSKRRPKRARRSQQRHTFEQLELRALLSTTTVNDSANFSVVNHNQFGAGNAFVSSNNYFLGGSFNTGEQSVGGFVYPFGLKTGVQASFGLSGKAGLDLGYFVNSGSVSAGYDGKLTQSFDDPQAIGNVPISTGVALSNGTLSTQSPTFGASADALLHVAGNVGIDAAAFGADSSFNKSFDTGSIDQPLFSVNKNNDQSIKVLGQPTTFSHTFGVQVDEVPPVSIDTNVSTTNNPLGASEDLSVALEQNDGESTGANHRDSSGNSNENGGGNGASVSFHLASASQTLPDIQLSASQSGSSGDLSANTTDGASTQLANLQLEMGPLAAALLDLPPVFTTMEFSAGPATVDVTPLSFQLGPTLYANQAVSATPSSAITYVFDHPVGVELGASTTYQMMNQVTFTPGEALKVQFDGTPIQVTPYWNFQLQFHNRINLDVSLNSTLTIGEVSATVNLPSWVQSALGLPATIGPLYQQNFDLANFPAITAFDQTFDILDKSVAMQPFTIGANFNPSLTVTRNDDPNATAGTLRAAVNNANLLAAENGANEGPDVIVLGPGTYTLSNAGADGGSENGATGDLDVTDPNLTIVGAGAGQTTILAATGLKDRIFDVRSGGGLHLKGVTISGGNAAETTDDGTPGLGGGILNDGGALSLDHVDVSGNYAPDGGGIAIVGGTTTISNSTIENNTASVGGGLSNVSGGDIEVENTNFTNNAAAQEGGAISASAAAFCLLGGVFYANESGTSGGAIYNLGAMSIAAADFKNNTANQLGGAILNDGGQLTMTDDSFEQNNAASGGAVGNISQGEIDASGSTFSNNQATDTGGAFYNGPDETQVSMSDSTLVGNQAASEGAIYDASPTFFFLDAVTIARNSATAGSSSHQGGGIYVLPNAFLDLHNSIVADNSAGDSSSPDAYGPIASNGHNLIGIVTSEASGITNGADGDLAGNVSSPLDPKLGPLQNNGGTTLTVGLLPGSPAIDAGDDQSAYPNDQRGFPRPSGAHVDIGAVEYIDSPLKVTDFSDSNVQTSISTKANGDCTLNVSQNITLRDAINMFNGQGGTNTINLLAGTYSLTRSGDDSFARRRRVRRSGC